MSPTGAANAVKRKYAELVQDKTRESIRDEDAVSGLDAVALSSLSSAQRAELGEEASDIVRKEAQQKMQVSCETCGAPYGNRESLKRHIRKKHPRASGSRTENA